MKKVVSVAWITFREVLLQRLFYVSLILMSGLTVLSLFLSKLSFVEAERIFLYFGLFFIEIGLMLMAILLGSHVLPKEWESRTIHLLTSYPISKWTFLCGKYLGIVASLALNGSLFFGTLIVLFLFQYPAAYDYLTWSFGLGIFYLVLQLGLVLALAMALSTWTTPYLAVASTLSLCLVFYEHPHIVWLIQKMEAGWLTSLFQELVKMLPNFGRFQLKYDLLYGTVLPMGVWINTTLYALSWTLVFLGLGWLGFHQTQKP